MDVQVNTAEISDHFVTREQYKKLLDQNEKLLSENEFLTQQLADLRRMIFGAKSERFIPTDTSQTALFSEPAREQDEAETVEISYSRRKKTEKKQPVRTALPAHLPRVEETIEPENLDKGAKKIGEEITEILEYNPGNIFVRRIIRPRYAQNNNGGIVIGELPTLPIPKGNAGPGLLAHILVSKFADHLPFYRQIQQYKRQGIALSDSTMGGWFNASVDLLEPLYNCLKKKILQCDYIQVDESPIRVQSSHKQGATHTGYQWVHLAPVEGLVLFKYQPNRGREGPNKFLNNFSGTLQTDGYKVYDNLKTKGDITLLACMAHARRKFEHALDNDQKRAEYAMKQIQRLYAMERKAREGEISFETRKRYRQLFAEPVLDELESWLKENHLQVTPRSAIGKAIAYTINLWPRLRRYTQEGRFEIDNNRIENAIRPLALGRKNYLFAGSHEAAQRAAIIYSFLATCKVNGIEPYAWLKNVLERIPDHKANKLEELLPLTRSDNAKV